jgi:geranylgeranyl diphosphate synthase type 3
MLHNASLLIDDIQDNSKLRRGAPVAHSIYGVPLTINAANHIYFLAMQKALLLKHPDVTQIFVGLFSKEVFILVITNVF